MKKIYIFAIGLLAFYFCNAQDKALKTKVTKDQNIATAVTINKKTKQKEGLYLEVDMNTGDTLVAGQYANDKRTGLWQFSDKKVMYFEYDFTENLMKRTSPLIHAVDTFIVKAGNGQYTLSQVDTPPLFLGYKNEFEALLSKSIRIPLQVTQNHVAGTAVVSFVIDEHGLMKDVQSEAVLDKELDREIVRRITEMNGEWLPAVKDGKPVNARFMVVVSLSEGQNTSPAQAFAPKPYLIPVMLTYYSTVRTERRIMQSISPQQNIRYR
jgi:Gram-negative bacterial tonB protein.